MNTEVARSWDIAVRGHTNRVGALALIVWDFFLTFDDERELFWKKPFTLATYLFIWSRYVGLIVTVFWGFCRHVVYRFHSTMCELAPRRSLAWTHKLLVGRSHPPTSDLRSL